jgi:membrane fusion protein, multidrug efflux system
MAAQPPVQERAAQQAQSVGDAPVRSPTLGRRGRLGLIIVGAVLLSAALAYGSYWLLHGRFIVSTNDAYLRADAVTVAPRVSGYIDQIFVSDNQTVRAGEPLLHIDARTYADAQAQQKAALDARRADIGAAESEIRQQEAVILQNRSQLEAARARAQFARTQEHRYHDLFTQGADTEEHYAQAVNDSRQAAATEAGALAAVRVAERQLATYRSQWAQAGAQLESAEAALSTAQQNLADTTVRASIDGIVGDKSARLGQYVQPGTRLLSVVPVHGIYLVANFKETQLSRMRIGQPARIKVDALGGTVIPGRLESFAPGTGAQFALLPPENATGNFIKIVQRVPVRFQVLPPPELAKRLLPGLSVTVSVDTSKPAS